MNNKMLSGVVLAVEAGTIAVFGSLFYKLKKEHDKLKLDYANLNRVQTAKMSNSSEDNIDFNNIKLPGIRKIVTNFYDKLSKEPGVDLTNFKNNFKTLKFKSIRKYDDGNSVYAEALYDYYNNTIYYGLLVKPRILAHELFHMASTIYDEEEKNIRLVGFGQSKYEKEIGMGLTEGYTELLAKRYFGNDIYEDGVSDSYVVEMSIVKSLETIIGKDKMMKFYFTADLKGLINELKKYNDVENIISFVSSVDEIALDTMSGEEYLSKSKYKKHLINVFEFLIKTYSNKQQYDKYTNQIDEDEFYKRIEEFINDLNDFNYIKYGTIHRIQVLSKKTIIKIIKNMFKEDRLNLSFDEDLKKR